MSISLLLSVQNHSSIFPSNLSYFVSFIKEELLTIFAYNVKSRQDLLALF